VIQIHQLALLFNHRGRSLWDASACPHQRLKAIKPSLRELPSNIGLNKLGETSFLFVEDFCFHITNSYSREQGVMLIVPGKF